MAVVVVAVDVVAVDVVAIDVVVVVKSVLRSDEVIHGFAGAVGNRAVEETVSP